MKRARLLYLAISLLAFLLSPPSTPIFAFGADRLPVAPAGNLAPVGTFIVNSTEDTEDGSCDVAHCTLREAIHAANAQSGPDKIIFNLGGGIPTILVGGSPGPTANLPLPQISSPLTIDGNTGGAERVELNGNTLTADVSAHGLWITAGNTTIRALVINRFKGSAIRITDGSSNTIEGNYLGTDGSGTAALGNGAGVIITRSSESAYPYSTFNLIGGMNAGAGNVISGNNVSIVIDYSCDCYFEGDNLIQGNYIGTDVTGTRALGNGYGLVIRSVNNLIGGTDARARNVISANEGVGVFIDGPYATGNKVQGNFIGTDVTGTLALGNKYAGILILQGLTLIGGVSPGAGNLISGNRGPGIDIEGGRNTVVQGNLIGTDVTGTLDLGNTDDGVFIANGTQASLIGGTDVGARNVISGNADNGIEIVGCCAGRPRNNRVQGNLIGTDRTGKLALGNGGNGVLVNTFSGTRIGGKRQRTRNRIAFNDKSGVRVAVSARTAILRNSMFSNGQLGIEIEGDRNNLSSAPVLHSVSVESHFTRIRGTLNSTPNQTFRIEFFSSPACDPAGSGEGKRFLGFGKVTTGRNGNGSFDVLLKMRVAINHVLTATSTDAADNTSEFSVCHTSQ